MEGATLSLGWPKSQFKHWWARVLLGVLFFLTQVQDCERMHASLWAKVREAGTTSTLAATPDVSSSRSGASCSVSLSLSAPLSLSLSLCVCLPLSLSLSPSPLSLCLFFLPLSLSLRRSFLPHSVSILFLRPPKTTWVSRVRVHGLCCRCRRLAALWKAIEAQPSSTRSSRNTPARLLVGR